MSETSKFVVLSDKQPSFSWVDEDSIDAKQLSTDTKTTAWGTMTEHTDAAPDLSTILAEETEKAMQAKPSTKGIYRPPTRHVSGFRLPYTSSASESRNKEKLPLPTEPPYTAFVGNLSFDVTNEILSDFFCDLGVNSIRIITEDSRSKGFAYIEFTTQDGLKKALTADGLLFYGRSLHMEVAKPPSRSISSRSSGSHSYSDKSRYDTTWASSRNFNPPARGAERAPTERPRNIYPPPTSTTPLSQDQHAKPKGPSFENPFGAANLDHKKMDILAQERLKKELEIENREREKKEEYYRNYRPARTASESESKSNTSWRSQRRDPHPKKQIRDEEGFVAKLQRGDNLPKIQKHSQAPPTTNTPKTNQTEKSNIYATLSEQND